MERPPRKLRRRRALVLASVALIVGPTVVSYVVLAALHAASPEKYGPAGGVDNLRGALQWLVGSGSQWCRSLRHGLVIDATGLRTRENVLGLIDPELLTRALDNDALAQAQPSPV